MNKQKTYIENPSTIALVNYHYHYPTPEGGGVVSVGWEGDVLVGGEALTRVGEGGGE